MPRTTRSLLLFLILPLFLSGCDQRPLGPEIQIDQPHPQFSLITFSPYTAIDLGTLGGNASDAKAINSVGQVAGISRTSSGEMHGFLWDVENGMTDIGTLGGASSYARTLNDAGQIVGQSYTPTGSPRAFFWDPEEGMIDLGTLGGTSSYSVALNNAGQVIATSSNAAGHWHGFFWDPVDRVAVSMEDLDELRATGVNAINNSGWVAGSLVEWDGTGSTFLWNPTGELIESGVSGSPWAMNESGQVVGSSGDFPGAMGSERAFFWDPAGGGMVELGVNTLRAIAINESGQVAGNLSVPGGLRHPFIWDVGERVLVDIGTLGGTSWAYDQNNSGQVTGWSVTSTGQIHGFVWDPDEGMIDLGTLGGNKSEARDINDEGCIVGHAELIGGVEDHAVLWCKLTPMGALDRLIEMVQTLHDAGVLNKGQANSLINKVNIAILRVNKGKIGPAISMIEAFIHEVDAFMKPPDNAILSPEDGQPLLDAADFAIAELNG